MKKVYVKTLGILINLIFLFSTGMNSETLCTESSENNEPTISVEEQRALLVQQYKEAPGIAFFKLPMVELRSQKESFTTDLTVHMENNLNAQLIDFPVSQEYFDSLGEGEVLDLKFDLLTAVVDGKLESYKVTVNKKFFNNLYCIVNQSGCTEIDEKTYGELLSLNEELQKMNSVASNLYLREEDSALASSFEKVCKVELESYKTNLTLDLYKHFKNSLNKLNYEVELPGFFCNELTPGYIIDEKFIGWNFISSTTYSWITYKVIKVEHVQNKE